MSRFAIVPHEIVCTDKAGTILKNHSVIINDDIIESIIPEKELNNFNGDVIYEKELTLIPGFIQTHLHLCQTLFRGLAEDLRLLDWLQFRIFPFENAHSKESMRMSVRLGLNELISGGTTTILDMGSLRHQEVIFEEIIDSGINAAAGKCMIDVNELYPPFTSVLKDELKYTEELASAYHNAENGRIRYAFAPRFLLTSSEKLLKEIREMMKQYPGSLFHTHASENKAECEMIRDKYSMDNIEYFDSIDLLKKDSVLAHCIHINDHEADILLNRNTAVAHCPSSNLKLASGIAPVPQLLAKGIKVSLGADGAPCNNSLSIFNEMRLASLIQKPVHGAGVLNAEKVFRMATIGGAEALNIDSETGSIETGKKADIVLLDLNKPDMPLGGDIYSAIVHSASDKNVSCVMARGRWLKRKGINLNYNQQELYSEGKVELQKLMRRAQN